MNSMIEEFEDFLSRMQGLLDNAKKQGHIIVRVEDIENTFPELKESEDEKIRKWLLAQLEIKIGDNATLNNMIYKAIAWLERQGEKPQGKSALEAINEEKVDNQNCVKPTDKVESKFKVGDYVTNGHFECEIESVDDTTYYCDFTNFDIKDQDNWKLVEKETDFKFELNFNYSVGQWIVACGKKVFLITKIDGAC